MLRNRRKLLVAAAFAVAAGMIASIAIAAWSVTGSGTGYAKAGSAAPLTLGSATASADLVPGGTGALKLSVSNPNGFPVRITAVTGNGAITSDKGAACNASTGVSLTNQSGLTLDLTQGETDKSFTINGVLSMTNASHDTCQGAVFSVPVTLTAISNAS